MLVVTKGPVAIAGSTSIFLKIRGINVPIAAAMSMDEFDKYEEEISNAMQEGRIVK